MDTILAISTAALALFTFILAVATVVMAKSTHKLASEARDASFREIGIDTWMELSRRFDSVAMVNSRSELAQEIRRKPRDLSGARRRSENVLNFFEDLGTLHRENYIDHKLARDTFGFYATRWWLALMPLIEIERKAHHGDTTLYQDFEQLEKADASSE